MGVAEIKIINKISILKVNKILISESVLHIIKA